MNGNSSSASLRDSRVGAREVAILGGGIALGTVSAIFGAPLKAQLSVAPVAGPTGITGGALGLSGTF